MQWQAVANLADLSQACGPLRCLAMHRHAPNFEHPIRSGLPDHPDALRLLPDGDEYPLTIDTIRCGLAQELKLVRVHF